MRATARRIRFLLFFLFRGKLESKNEQKKRINAEVGKVCPERGQFAVHISLQKFFAAQANARGLREDYETYTSG